MTLRPIQTPNLTRTVRKKFLDAAAALLLSAPAALLATTASAASFDAQSALVYPRAAVSSDAYRTPLAVFSSRPANATMAAQANRRAPALLAQAPSARPIGGRQAIVPVQHTEAQPVSAQQERPQSVQAELRRLYAEEGRQMPQMTMPSYQPEPPGLMPTGQPLHPTGTPDELNDERKEPGIFAGLFDFSRSRSLTRGSARGGAPLSPPSEPRPFQPPTYRQQPQQRTTQQPARRQPAAQQRVAESQGRPQTRQPQSQQTQTRTPAARQQPTAQSAQEKSLVNLKKVPSDRKFAMPEEAFFPGDDSQTAVIVPNTNATVIARQDDLAEFFPAGPTPQKPAAIAVAKPVVANPLVDSVKSNAQQLLDPQSPDAAAIADHNAADVENDGFAMPEAIEEEPIIPNLAPAVASEVVTTEVAPYDEYDEEDELEEPAAFFAEGERAINPQEEMDIAALTGRTFDPSGADSANTAGTVTDRGSLMQQIAARDGVGLKGFCPVTLRDDRRLADGRVAYVSYYQNKAYYFASAGAKETFDSDPEMYAPAASGEDVALMTLTGEVVEGSLDFSVWYKGQLYLFQSAENLKMFMAAPSAMAVVN